MSLLDWELKQEPLWKQEPYSPTYGRLDYDDDALMFNDDLAFTQEERPLHQEKLSRAERATKLLLQLQKDLNEYDDLVKDEPYNHNNWLEEKIELPILEDLRDEQSRNPYYGVREPFIEAVKQQPLLVETSQNPKEPLPPLHAAVNETQALLQEFETIYEEVEFNNATLTPPQSPTIVQHGNQYQVTNTVAAGNSYFFSVPQIISVEPITPVPITMAPVTPFISVMPEKLTNLEQMVPATPNPDIDKELAEVDELVRSRAEDLDASNSTWEQAITDASCEDYARNVSPLSPSTSSNSSEDSADDPEWIPELNDISSPGPQKSSSRKQRANSSKPYSRPVPEEKRQRKKEQNKNAATRYRQKKKAEIDKISSEEKELEKKNDDLKQKMSDLSREIKYLKGLMRDVFRAKGLIK